MHVTRWCARFTFQALDATTLEELLNQYCHINDADRARVVFDALLEYNDSDINLTNLYSIGSTNPVTTRAGRDRSRCSLIRADWRAFGALVCNSELGLQVHQQYRPAVGLCVRPHGCGVWQRPHGGGTGG